MTGLRLGSAAVDVAALLLLGWGLLLAWISLRELLGGRLLADRGVGLLGVMLGLLHVTAATGIARRSGWSREVGIGLAAIGLFGSISVLGLFLGGVRALLDVDPGATLVFVAIPVGMALSDFLVLVALLRGRTAFGGQT